MDRAAWLLFFTLCTALAWHARLHADEIPVRGQPVDQVSFRVQAGRELANDLGQAVLYLQREGRDSASLADAVNRGMRQALKRAGAEQAVKVSTGAYRTWPVYDKNRIVRWRVSQELRLESSDMAALTRVVGALQDQLQVRSMQFLLSPAARESAEESLTVEALGRFQRRARAIATALGASGYRLGQLDISSSGPPPVVGLRREVAAAGVSRVAAPAVEQGVSRVQVTVSGSIRLLRAE